MATGDWLLTTENLAQVPHDAPQPKIALPRSTAYLELKEKVRARGVGA